MLGIKAPAFSACRSTAEGAQLPEGGQALVLNLLSDIEVMTWNGLMIDNSS